ncbi:hypothetical protein [Actinacidiphila guanduensis]|uniref:Uncharacterized protein n=1 Tax=Actinacidiphila guanduensis TaxID=310781 RepID=A0A1H0SEE0_9ACTN|nr:hypothetical protein [Actinacidiphila guanduensis]SDP39546.1 hypothetical protein SAMN05216259_12721 [Actinacidiphila guanduensis]
MADLVVDDNLKKRFTQFDDIANVTGDLQSKIEEINDQNKKGGGESDEYAKAYHKQVDDATQNLSDLVDRVREFFANTADSGKNASDQFSKTEDEAATVASQW